MINGYGKAGRPLAARRARHDREPAAAHLDAVGGAGLGGRPAPPARAEPRRRARSRHRQRDRRRVLRRLAVRRARARRSGPSTRSRRSPRPPSRRSREGAVGAGTGTICFGFKAGIGGASRRTDEPRSAASCAPTTARRRDLHLLVGPGERRAPTAREPPAQGGSIMIVLGHGRAAVGAPAGPPGRPGRVRARPRRQLRLQRERRVRARLLDAQRIPHRSDSGPARAARPARRLARAARAVRGGRRGGPRGRAQLALRGRADGGPRRQPRRRPCPTSCSRRRPGLVQLGLTRGSRGSPSPGPRAAPPRRASR